MKTKIIKNSAIATGIIAIIILIRFSFASGSFLTEIENAFLKSLKEKFMAFNEQMPEDRVYMQFDKPFYQPGETIWFSAYLRNGSDMKASQKSDILHVELQGPKGNVEKEINLIAKNGRVTGDFSLDEEAPGGLYKIRAYTNWQKNEGDTLFFTKELQVQDVVLPNLKMNLEFERKAFGAGDMVVAKLKVNTNENQPLSNFNFKYVVNLEGKKINECQSVTGNDGEMYVKFKLPQDLKTSDGLLNILIDYQGQTESISRSIPIVLNTINFTMFPEGGDLVSNMQSNVAFAALNEFGKPADVEGVVTNSKGVVITKFASYHNGMGAFPLKPESNEKYTVKITKPVGVKEIFSVPEALPMGYVMSLDNTNSKEIDMRVLSPNKEEMSVVAQVRGKLCFTSAINVNPGNNDFKISTENFPMGVSQITLFDSKGIERAERLVFVNKAKQLSISVETDKEKYLPREKVKMTITVKDERGMPMPASLSMAVTNDQLLAFADDKSGNILSQLFLEQDLKGKIVEPAFYFSKEAKSDKALDLLLMTKGWRRFTWKKILEEGVPALTFNGEKAVYSGVVMDAYSGKPVENAKIKINNSNLFVQTDESGKFSIKNLDLTSPVSLVISGKGYGQQAVNVGDYTQNTTLYLYNQNYYGNYEFKMDAVGGGAMKGAAMANEMAPAGMAGDNRNVNKMGAKPNDAPLKRRMVKENINKAIVKVEGKKELEKAEKKQAENRVKDIVAVKNNKDKAKLLQQDAPLQDAKAVFAMAEGMDIPDANQQQQQVVYYRAKEFSAPIYDKEQKVEIRNDFRSTIYWNGNIEIDRSGKKTVEFYNSDDISSFRTTIEGVSADGMVGRTEKVFFTQLPFAMTAKVPTELVTEDLVSIPLTLKNNTNASVSGKLEIKTPEGLKMITAILPDQTLLAGSTKVISLDYKVLNKIGEQQIDIAFTANGMSDAFSQKIKISPKGFPVTASFAGDFQEKEYTVDIENVVDGSITASLTAYPSVVSDLMKGVDGILREPSGCFEQTSMSSYPNILVLDYLKTTDNKDDKLLASAEKLVDKGYKRLITFETKEKGYEWFGGAPAHEALTAYGLMQFNDMKNVYNDVDEKMIDRTAKWIMDRKDGKGGFKRNSRALDNFGGASEEITNAYIVWALSEGGYKGMEKETDNAYKMAMNTKDPYQLGLVANSLYKQNDIKRATKVMDLLYSLQSKEGSWTGTTHSVTRSGGISLTVETTSLAILAMLKSTERNGNALNKAVEYLVSARSGYGVFGSTQGTIMALKALTEYAKKSKRTAEDGTIAFYVDGKKVAEKAYKAGTKDPITIDNLNQYIKEGKHELKVKYIGVKNPLPYSLAVSWNTFLPGSSKDCKVNLKTKLFAKSTNVGETVRLEAIVKNTTNEGLPSTMVILGIPSGLSLQPWQLKELKEKNVFDYYEIIGSTIAIYYRQMAPSEIKTISLDLKAEVPGNFEAQASSAYLYYTNEFKCWTGLDRISVKAKN